MTEFPLINALFWGPLYMVLDAVYRGLRCVFHWAQQRVWHLDSQPNAARSCERLRIIFKKKNFITDEQDFVWVHEAFESIDILEDNHWLMHRLSPHYAYFARMPAPVHTDYNAIQSAFLWHDTFYQCTELARMPLQAFLEHWSERTIRGRTAIVHNPSRCGSTLLMQMLTLPAADVVTMSEPDILQCLGLHLGKATWPENRYRQVFQASINALCKNIDEHQLAVIKNFTCRLVPYFKAACPSVINLYFYRKNVPAMLTSTEKLVVQMDRRLYDYQLSFLRLLLPYIDTVKAVGLLPEYSWDIMGIADVKPGSFREVIAFRLGVITRSYSDNRDAFALPAVFYEDLVKHPRQFLMHIFDFLKIPRTFLDTSLARMKEDSQKGTFLSRELLADIKPGPNTEAQIVGLRRIAAFYGFEPDFFLSEQKTIFDENPRRLA